VLDDIVGCLACPHCAGALARSGAALRCPAGHSFDIARQGYVSLLPPGARAAAGDTAAMVAARADFLAAGHFAGLAVALGSAVLAAAGVPGCVADIGAGTGYYLAAVLDQLPGRGGLALDASRFAVRRAARAHERIGAVAADAWQRLPVADGAACAVLNVFAPRNGAELRRILHPDGRLLVITPEPGHLAELAGPLGLLAVDPRKPERLAATLGPHFDLLSQRPYAARLELRRAELAAVAGMGPAAWHADPAVLAARIAALPARVPVRADVTLSEFRPRSRASASFRSGAASRDRGAAGAQAGKATY
jgi:23S rRNA (guanine745-N1)-methyltransferase